MLWLYQHPRRRGDRGHLTSRTVTNLAFDGGQPPSVRIFAGRHVGTRHRGDASANTVPNVRRPRWGGRAAWLLRDLSDDRPVQEVLAAYVVPAQDFVRWWDDTLELSQTLRFEDGLEQHLGDLQHNGIDLTVTEFTDAGYQGRGTREEGGWFTFGLRGRLQRGEPLSSSGQSTGGHKGAVDCDTGKLKAVVL